MCNVKMNINGLVRKLSTFSQSMKLQFMSEQKNIINCSWDADVQPCHIKKTLTLTPDQILFDCSVGTFLFNLEKCIKSNHPNKIDEYLVCYDENEHLFSDIFRTPYRKPILYLYRVEQEHFDTIVLDFKS